MRYLSTDELACGKNGEILHDNTGVEYDERVKKVYDLDGDAYSLSDVKFIEIKDGELYIVPIENLDDYIKDGIVFKDFPSALKLSNWSHSYSKRKPVREGTVRDRGKLRSKIFKEIDLFEDDEDELVPIDRILTINSDDSEIIKEFKKACNKTKIRAHKESIAWVKSALREVDNGTISSKSLELLIKQLKFKYTVQFFKEV